MLLFMIKEYKGPKWLHHSTSFGSVDFLEDLRQLNQQSTKLKAWEEKKVYVWPIRGEVKWLS